MFLVASYTILGTYLVYKNTNKMPPVQPEYNRGPLTYLVYKNTNKMPPVQPEYNRGPLTNHKLQEFPSFFIDRKSTRLNSSHRR